MIDTVSELPFREHIELTGILQLYHEWKFGHSELTIPDNPLSGPAVAVNGGADAFSAIYKGLKLLIASGNAHRNEDNFHQRVNSRRKESRLNCRSTDKK